MTLLGKPLETFEVPVVDSATGKTIFAPLRHSQIASLERRYQPGTVNQPTSKDSRALLALAMGLGKTMVFSLQSIEAIAETKRPAFYSVWRTAIIDDVEEEFRRVFRHFVGREPVIHRYPDPDIDHTKAPDLVMGTPQFFYSYKYYEGHRHPALSHQFSIATFDEAHHWPAPKHLEVLQEVQADTKLGLTGTLDRMDDPHLGHRVIEIFGQPRYKRLLEDAVASGEVRRPDYRLSAVNIGPLLHEVMRGRFSYLALNRSVFVPELNDSYEKEFRKHYSELKRPQSIIVCKSIEHLNQMAEVLKDLDTYPIHSGLSKEQLQKNKDQFFKRHKKGSIALVVDMWNEGVNFPHLGLMMQTATTMSRTKFFQTLGRCTRSDVRFVDVTMSQAHIAHVRLFHERVGDTLRSSDEIIPYQESASGIRFDESVQQFEDVLKLQEMKQDFFFALGAAGLAQHLRREKDHHKNVVLDIGTDVLMENGMTVRLLDKESVNVSRWHKELHRDSSGDIDLSPERNQLLRTLGVSHEELTNASFSQRRTSNGSKRIKQIIEPEKYFDSEEFWTGYHLFQARFSPRFPSFPFIDQSDLRQLSLAFYSGDFTKIFDGKGNAYPEPIDFTFFTDRFPLYYWYDKTLENLALVNDEVRAKILEAGMFFPDPQIVDAFARVYENSIEEYSIHLREMLGNGPSPKGPAIEMPFEPYQKFCVFDKGTEITIGANRQLTIPVDMYVASRALLQRVHSPNALGHLSTGQYDQAFISVSQESPKVDAKKDKHKLAWEFSRSDYFWMGVQEQAHRESNEKIDASDICEHLHDIIGRQFPRGSDEDLQDIFFQVERPTMKFSEWRTDVKKHYDFLPDEIKRGLSDIGITPQALFQTKKPSAQKPEMAH